jgi:hypothetical protein
VLSQGKFQASQACFLVTTAMLMCPLSSHLASGYRRRRHGDTCNTVPLKFSCMELTKMRSLQELGAWSARVVKGNLSPPLHLLSSELLLFALFSPKSFLPSRNTLSSLSSEHRVSPGLPRFFVRFSLKEACRRDLPCLLPRRYQHYSRAHTRERVALLKWLKY